MTRIPTDKPFLFDIGSEFRGAFDNDKSISTKLRRVFNKNGVSLSRDVSISVQTPGSAWMVTDKDEQKVYAVRRKGEKLSIYGNLHVVNQIVERDLCVRCGACEPACPVDIIRFNEQGYPFITDEQSCLTTCTRCLKVCPGESIDFAKLDAEMFGLQPHPESITGMAKRALVSFATDDRVRFTGTSGGFVTQLLVYMLDKRLIDGALVLGASADSGSWKQQPFIARSTEELKRAMKSKYIVVPFLQPLGEMEQIEGNYAVVGLPCYIHALRKYQKVSKKLRERIKLVIGLYCNVVFEPHLFDDACEFNGIPKEDVAGFHFRYGDWPGGVVAELHDGRTKKVLKLEEMKNEFNLLKLLYTAPRCNMCVDFSAEYADLAVGDPWLRGPDGKYLFEDDRTTVLIRTDIGEQIVDMAAADGYINVQDIPLKTYMLNFEPNARYKRDFVPKYLMMRKLFKLPVPEYNRPIGHGKPSGYLPMLIRVAILAMAQFKWFRRFALSLAQTRPALAYYTWGRRRKAKRFANRYPKLERFAEKLAPRGHGTRMQDEHSFRKNSP